MKRLLFLFALLLCLSASAAVTNYQYSVTLAWEPWASGDVAEYRIYYGVASHTYTNSSVAVAATVTNATVTGLKANTTYFFAATAKDSWGLESDFSNEVAYTTPATELPPQNLALISVAVQQSTNLIDWTTITNAPLVYVGTTNGTRYYRAQMGIAGH